MFYYVSYPDLPCCSPVPVHWIKRKTKYELTFFVYFPSQLLALHIIMIYHHLKLSPAHTLHLHKQQHSSQQVLQFHYSSCGSTVYCWVIKAVISQWLPTDDTQSVLLCVSDSLQLVVKSAFIDCFSVFHSVCSLLSQLYSQCFTFSTSSCSSSQSTQLWHCVKDCCCGMISDCW